MTPFIRLTDAYAVAPQLVAADFARARAEGFTLVINNRPDGEAPGQLSDAAAAEAAAAAGLAYVHVPVRGAPTPDQARAVAAALAAHPGSALAYCRTGTRSTFAWALAQAQAGRPLGEIVSAASAAGYDLYGFADALRDAGAR